MARRAQGVEDQPGDCIDYIDCVPCTVHSKHNVLCCTCQVVVFEAGEGEVQRPRIEEEFEKVPGIRESFGFMASGAEGAVAQRGFDCWCKQCLQASGRSSGSMDSNCRVRGCLGAAMNELYGQYHDCPVSRLDTRGVAGQRIEAQSKGHLSAAKLKVNMLVAAQSRNDPNDPYIIGVAIDSGVLGSVSDHELRLFSCLLCVGNLFTGSLGDGTPIIERVIDRSKVIKGTLFTRGDYCVAIRWMKREDADSERLTFTYDDSEPPDVLNSTEIRAIDFKMDKQQGLPTVRTTRSSSRNVARSPQNGTSCLAPELEKTILAACHA